MYVYRETFSENKHWIIQCTLVQTTFVQLFIQIITNIDIVAKKNGNIDVCDKKKKRLQRKQRNAINRYRATTRSYYSSLW